MTRKGLPIAGVMRRDLGTWHFGRYSVDPLKHTITFFVDRSSLPNQDGSTPVRPYEMNHDELFWRVAPRPDGSVPITVLRRARIEAKPQAKGLN